MASEGGGGGGVVVHGPPGGGGGGGGSGETESLLRGDGPGEAGEEDHHHREASERQAGPGEPEAGLEEEEEPPPGLLEELRQDIQGWLRPYGGLLMALQRLLVWERPLYSLAVALSLNTLFWLVSSMSLRPLFLISVSLMGLMLLERWKHKLALFTVDHVEPEPSQEQREPVHHPGLLSVPDLSLHLADSYLSCRLYLQEALQYKRQHHGKFCIMVCSGAAVLAVLGHYVPGIMISYIMALSVLLWPLVVYHELIQRMYTGLEPILMKLDYSMKGGAAGRRGGKRIIALLREVKKELESSGAEPRAETESDSEEEEEEELSCFAPTVDAKLTALAMAITDSELSDEEASILESGGFSVSRATTPNLSEDLDVQSVHSEPDESCLTSDLLTTSDLPEFAPEVVPSAEHHGLLHRAPPPRGPQGAPPHQAEEQQPPALSLLQQLASPLHFVNTHFNGHAATAGGDGGPGAAAAALLLGAVGGHEEEEGEEEEEEERPPPPDDVPPQHRRSLEALSEEIVSTAISAVVRQNTLQPALTAPPSGSEDQHQATVALEHFLPAAAETTPEETDTGASATAAEPEPAVVSSSSSSLDAPFFPRRETTETLRSGSKDHSLSSETSDATPRPAEDVGAADRVATTLAGDEPEGAAVAVGAAAPTEEEDFELLDQSELDEEGGGGGRGLGVVLSGSVGGTTSGATTDTPPGASPLPLHQPEESS